MGEASLPGSVVDGNWELFDYKTGREISVKTWVSSRSPEEPPTIGIRCRDVMVRISTTGRLKCPYGDEAERFDGRSAVFCKEPAGGALGAEVLLECRQCVRVAKALLPVQQYPHKLCKSTFIQRAWSIEQVERRIGECACFARPKPRLSDRHLSPLFY